MKFFQISICCAAVLSMVACQRGEDKWEGEKKPLSSEQLIHVNKYLLEKDNELIKAYMERRGWEMQKTGTGLWYDVYEKGRGKQVEKGKYVTIDYTVELLDGTLCYTSEMLGPKTFLVGKGGVESGLEEGILLLNQGDKARFIMPPHLAHHLLGDEDRIPARATIVYDLELLKISETR
jgi:FKBP-type peptidyl-prolyl cis-trans isomerase FkpA